VSYNFVAEMRVCLHSFSRWRHQNLWEITWNKKLGLLQFKVIQGHRPWCHADWKRTQLPIYLSLFESGKSPYTLHTDTHACTKHDI